MTTKIPVELSSTPGIVDGSNATAITIDSSERVGIGTTSPTGKLEIAATGTNAAPHIKLVESGDTREFNIFNDGAGNGHLALADSDDDAPDTEIVLNDNGVITMNTVDVERMRIDSSGNLLVGTTSSQGLITATTTGSTTFDCARTETSTANNIILRNGNGAVGSIQTSGSSTSYNTSSDQRLKENITDSDEARSKVNAIQVRKFNWKVDGSYQPYGMIAQELQSIVPEAVSSPEKPEEMFGVDYSKLVPLLTKAIQEQQKLIEDLKSRIEVLETPEAE